MTEVFVISILIMVGVFLFYMAREGWKEYQYRKTMNDPEKTRQYHKDNGTITIEDLESARRVYGSWARVWKSIRSDNLLMTPEARIRLWCCVMDEVLDKEDVNETRHLR